MTIASEISRLQTAKANMKTAITNKGVSVADSVSLSNYCDCINAIPTGSSDCFVEALVVGGGGAGGGGNRCSGGGGGAGGVAYARQAKVLSSSLPVVIGTGGTVPGAYCSGCNGGNSLLCNVEYFEITQNGVYYRTCMYGIGGGGGGTQDRNGRSGGQGGGAGYIYNCNISCLPGGSGSGYTGHGGGGSGGGGGGFKGEGGTGYLGYYCGGQGGKWNKGYTFCFAGGGGAGTLSSSGGCGTQGGGLGGSCGQNGCDATSYGGGGGGGGGCYGARGGAGYQGVVIVRYPADGSYGFKTATGGNCCNCVDGWCTHMFTSDGTFTITG